VTNAWVAYASQRGSSAEIADGITETLRQPGLSVDCIEAGKVSSVASYDAAVFGSAVSIKRWRGDAEHLLRQHDKELSQRPLWAFSSGPVGDPMSEADLYVKHRHQLRSRRAAMSEGYSTRPPVWTWPEWRKAKPARVSGRTSTGRTGTFVQPSKVRSNGAIIDWDDVGFGVTRSHVISPARDLAPIEEQR
jgi:hypothetical protein